MFVRLYDLMLNVTDEKEKLKAEIAKALSIPEKKIVSFSVYRRSLDARNCKNLRYIYAVDAEIENGVEFSLPPKAEKYELREEYRIKKIKRQSTRPVIVGFGPCGMFLGLILARAGAMPIILERGKKVSERTRDVDEFFKSGKLCTNSNIQFGEGGAGTFSDGKLNTLVKDKNNRGRFVLSEFVKAGAPEEILYVNKPHIGTDKLKAAVTNIRNEIIALGGDVRFESVFCGYETEDDRVCAVTYKDKNENITEIKTDTLFLCIGHSSRDTFEYLSKQKILLEQKSFAVGVRIEHTQEWLNRTQYKSAWPSPYLPAADYKLVSHTDAKRALYTFCMCPGGEVVAATSEEGGVVTNGMSLFARDNTNCNSALLVGVDPADFGTDDILAGVRFQRELERCAYRAGGGEYKAPAQTVGSFLGKKGVSSFSEVLPSYSRGTKDADLHTVLPKFITETLKTGLLMMDRSLHGFAADHAVLTAVESRSSSPIRIVRDENLESSVRGIYPLGEGAGYAGGIMSAAMDGMRGAEIYIEKHI
ncbi:MAG: hypothetical protein J5922_05680 [Clostridia bacterium]|nr:hypothetical protein [Clostridia bacterium]